MQCYQNPYLPHAGSHLDAIVSVTAGLPSVGAHDVPGTLDGAPAGDLPAVSEVIILDASGSMDGEKIRQARAAACVALDGLRPGVRFAVVAGTDTARMVYPEAGQLVAAGPRTVDAAKDAVRHLQSGGGTAIGSWLRRATELLSGEPGIRHAILLTDGRDEERRRALTSAIDAARGVFQCDCRGVGVDFSLEQLRLVSDALLGTTDLVAEPSGLAADFASMTVKVMGLRAMDVVLRVWTPVGVCVASLRQVSPELVDLTPRVPSPGDPAGLASAAEYDTGAWGEETRDYHLRLTVPAGDVGEEILAARVSLEVSGDVAATALVRGIWTQDLELSTRVNRQVEHYECQSQMAQAIHDGVTARVRGDLDNARLQFGAAAALAFQAGHTEMLDMLATVVEIEDAPTGRVRLVASASVTDEMTLDTRSTRTTRVRHPKQ